MCTAILALWLYGANARSFLRGTGFALVLLGVVAALAARSHRQDAVVLAGCGLAALTAGLVWPRCEPAEPRLRRLGLAAFFAVVLQGVLGGLRVVLFKDQIGIFHATLAQLFFVLVCALALFTSPWWQRNYGWNSPQTGPRRARLAGGRRLAWLCLGASGLILAQLILGATMRHQHAGLAIPDFPTAYGKFWPALDPHSVAHYNQQRIEVVDVNPITAFQVVLQMVHRFVALCIFALIGGCAWFARKELGRRHLLARLALGWLGLVLVQVLLGAATIWSNKAADIATAHVLVGALTLAFGTILSLVVLAQTAGLPWLSVKPKTATADLFGAAPSTAGIE